MSVCVPLIDLFVLMLDRLPPWVGIMKYMHPRVISIEPANSKPIIGQITLFMSAVFDGWYFCILPLVEYVELVSIIPISAIVELREIVELVSTIPISAIVELREIVELNLTEYTSATVELKKLVEFVTIAPVIVELRVTESQFIPIDLTEQSRGNFSS